jgi:hypothetical protein
MPIPGLSAQAQARLDALAARLKQPGEAGRVNVEAEVKASCTRGELAALVAAQATDHFAWDALGLLLREPGPLDAASLDRLLALIASPTAAEGLRSQAAQVVAQTGAGVARLVELTRPGHEASARVMGAAGLAHAGSAADEATRREATLLLLTSLGNEGDSARLASNAFPALDAATAHELLDRLARPDAPVRLVEYGLPKLDSLPKEQLRAERHAAAAAHLGDGTANARMAAVNGLRALGLTQADLPLYRRALADPEVHVHRMMLAGLADSPQPWAAPLLRSALDDALDENRAMAAQGLAQLGDRAAVPLLMKRVEQGLASQEPFTGSALSAAAAVAHVARLKGYDFSTPAECVPMGEGGHAIVVRDNPAAHRQSAEKLLRWWQATGKGERW